jgi:ATP/maltotriose-dependent transcriptional regulator MalT
MIMAEAIDAGRAALRRGSWAQARERFREALVADDSAAAYEGLGIAARYLGDGAGAVSAHERGYRLARAREDPESAARLATQLGLDAYGSGRLAEANGWIERALMLTDGCGNGEARAFALALRGHVAMLVRNDPEQARRSAAEALRVARACGSTDVEIVALALEGLALVCGGAVEDGMRGLDAATAAVVAGEVADVDMAETVCCYLIDACKRVRDLDRATEWCDRVGEIATRFEDRFMFAVCRIHHADVLLWHGDWPDADRELEAATDVLRPSGRAADSLVRVAELRRRQRRFDECEALLAQSEDHRLHALHAGLLALDRGEPQEALDAAHRFLRRVGDGDRFTRVAGLELLVRAGVQVGEAEAAAAAASEIQATAAAVGTGVLQASALLAAGRIAAAGGDPAAARIPLEDAAHAFEAAGAPFEASQAWAELAAVLRLLGRERRAFAAEERAAAIRERLGVAAPAYGGAPGVLSRRECEVLRLLAAGGSNDEIAATLFLSVRTVERHVANIYGKLRLSGRTARAAATAWAHAHGIA